MPFFMENELGVNPDWGQSKGQDCAASIVHDVFPALTGKWTANEGTDRLFELDFKPIARAGGAPFECVMTETRIEQSRSTDSKKISRIRTVLRPGTISNGICGREMGTSPKCTFELHFVECSNEGESRIYTARAEYGSDCKAKADQINEFRFHFRGNELKSIEIKREADEGSVYAIPYSRKDEGVSCRGMPSRSA